MDKWNVILWAIGIPTGLFTTWAIIGIFNKMMIYYVTTCQNNSVCDLTGVSVLIIGSGYGSMLAVYLFKKQSEQAEDLARIPNQIMAKLQSKEEDRTGHALSSFNTDLKKVKEVINALLGPAKSHQVLIQQYKDLIDKKNKLLEKIDGDIESSVGAVEENLLHEIKKVVGHAKIVPQWESVGLQGRVELRDQNNGCKTVIRRIDEILEKIQNA